MAQAKNMKQLNKMLENHLKRAMKSAANRALSDMRDETVGFYTDTAPKRYERTGALGETPRVTDVQISSSESGSSATFKAYLDQEHQYSTGRGPSMKTVLEHANRGGDMSNPPMRAVVGNSGFWERAEVKMEQSFNDELARHFNQHIG